MLATSKSTVAGGRWWTLGLPSVTVATVRQYPFEGCRARSVVNLFLLSTARRTTAATGHRHLLPNRYLKRLFWLEMLPY
jgi:hypothetical protein